ARRRRAAGDPAAVPPVPGRDGRGPDRRDLDAALAPPLLRRGALRAAELDGAGTRRQPAPNPLPDQGRSRGRGGRDRRRPTTTPSWWRHPEMSQNTYDYYEAPKTPYLSDFDEFGQPRRPGVVTWFKVYAGFMGAMYGLVLLGCALAVIGLMVAPPEDMDRNDQAFMWVMMPVMLIFC